MSSSKLCDTVIPYNIYFDDFQINNQLGSHSYYICACFYSFPTIPQHLQTKLDFVFLAPLISSKYLKFMATKFALKS